MLQAASLYFQTNPWSLEEMVKVMWEVISISLQVLQDDLEI